VILALNMMRGKLHIQSPNTQRISAYARPWLARSSLAPTLSATILRDMYAEIKTYLSTLLLTFLEKGDYAEASPCTIASLPQSRLEPILVRFATQNGFQNRFDTKFLSFEQDGKTGRIESMIEDLITNQKILVRSKYLCGADGAGSRIVRELQLPLHDLPGGGLSINLLVEADMVSR